MRSANRRTIGGVCLAGCLGIGLLACGGDDDGDWEARFWWGAHVATAGDEGRRQAIDRFEDDLGASMNAARIYRRWDDEFPSDDERSLAGDRRLVVLSIKPIRADGTRIAWADLAVAPAGSELDTELREWIAKARAFGRPIYVTLHHEPETTDDRESGTSDDYVAAWKRFSEIVRSDGGSKMRTMWIMTDASFGAQAADGQRAARWYPGDSAVDAIGVDAFNWHTCRGRSEPWLSLAALAEPARQFAALHPGRELWITEFGSVEDPSDPQRRHQWLVDAAALPNAPGWGQLHGLLYFDDEHGTEFPACDWRLSGNESVLDAFRGLADIPHVPPTTLLAQPTAG